MVLTAFAMLLFLSETCIISGLSVFRIARDNMLDLTLVISDAAFSLSANKAETSATGFFSLSKCRHGIPRASAMSMLLVSGMDFSG